MPPPRPDPENTSPFLVPTSDIEALTPPLLKSLSLIMVSASTSRSTPTPRPEDDDAVASPRRRAIRLVWRPLTPNGVTHGQTRYRPRRKRRRPAAGPEGADLIHTVRVPLTEDDNKAIRRKTDKRILTILIWVYFLQIFDKTVPGYGATFGLKQDANLTGNQYSLVGSIAPIAQLAWQPFSSILIVKVPHRILMPALVSGWGVAQACMAACHSFGGLMATRFLNIYHSLSVIECQ
ncbi:hypothetical protein BDV10DRAFT_187492 [Aspergillus recurvatus]